MDILGIHTFCLNFTHVVLKVVKKIMLRNKLLLNSFRLAIRKFSRVIIFKTIALENFVAKL